MKRVFINGVGAISAAGVGLAAHYHRLASGSSRIRYEEGSALRGCLEREGEAAVERMRNNRLLTRADRSVLLAAAAVSEACPQKISEDTAVIAGSSRGPAGLLEQFHEGYLEGEGVPVAASPSTTLSSMAASMAQLVGAEGPALFTSTACTTGITALGLAQLYIQNGLSSNALVATGESCLTPMCMQMFRQAQILARQPSVLFPMKSFHPERCGMIPGEAGAAMYLSNRTGPETLGEVLGVGSATERATMTGVSKDGAGLVRSVHLALAQAGLGPGDIDLLVAHGSATQLGDASEWQAYRQIFDERLPMVNCHKWLMGHSLGSAALLSAILGLEQAGLAEEVPPPYLEKTSETEPFFRKFPTTDEPVILVTALGFGGQSAAALIKRL